jgi:hypothetical protein
MQRVFEVGFQQETGSQRRFSTRRSCYINKRPALFKSQVEPGDGFKASGV